jgi:hypothetical protein
MRFDYRSRPRAAPASGRPALGSGVVLQKGQQPRNVLLHAREGEPPDRRQQADVLGEGHELRRAKLAAARQPQRHEIPSPAVETVLEQVAPTPGNETRQRPATHSRQRMTQEPLGVATRILHPTRGVEQQQGEPQRPAECTEILGVENLERLRSTWHSGLGGPAGRV